MLDNVKFIELLINNKLNIGCFTQPYDVKEEKCLDVQNKVTEIEKE